MTEQATLTPEEQAILALASAVCRTCEGTRVLVSSISNEDYTEEETTMDCPDCLDTDGKPTGTRFPTLSLESLIPGQHRRDPISWRNELKIRLALQDQGIRVEHQHRRWYVKLPGTTTAEGYDDNLAVAADSATRAEGVR